MAKESLLKSSIGKKFTMALSALFLLLFLLQHLTINLISVLSPQGFNETSYFMGHNPIIQYVMQPVLLIGVVYHFVMGFVLEIQNRKARGPVNYAVSNKAANSSWFSRNMIYSGGFILVFLLIHFLDFWFPTIRDHYICQVDGFGEGNWYYGELRHKFTELWRVALYVVGFVFLMLHLLHGFSSAFQSVGARHKKYTPIIANVGKFYAIIVPVGFIIITLYHYLTQLSQH